MPSTRTSTTEIHRVLVLNNDGAIIDSAPTWVGALNIADDNTKATHVQYFVRAMPNEFFAGDVIVPDPVPSPRHGLLHPWRS